MKYKIESWKFSTSFREDDSKTEVYYSCLTAAHEALNLALVARLKEIEDRTDVTVSSGKKYEMSQHEYDGDDLTVKLVWWKNHSSGGVVCMKDYFYLDYDLFEREVLE